MDAPGERVIVVDVPGGEIDRVLADPDVTTVLTDRFATIFLHPDARPELTARLGFPSLTAVDGDGCLRARLTSPPTPAAVIDTLNAALRARRDGRADPLPESSPIGRWPDDGAAWTFAHPDVARPFVDPVRGAPAVIWEGRPYIWGNRRDAEAVLPSPAAETFLASLPPGADVAPEAPPVVPCRARLLQSHGLPSPGQGG